MTPSDQHVDRRRTFGQYPTGVALVGAVVDDAPVGMLANSFTSVSLEPPLVSVSFDRASTSWPSLRSADRVGISLLGEVNLAAAADLRRPADRRFAGVTHTRRPDGALLLPGAVAHLVVALHDVVPAGDHEIALWRVLEHTRDETAAPLVFHRSTLQPLAVASAIGTDPGRTTTA